jgi:hypothetical protein
MNVALWIGQGLLAAVFLFSGTAKSTQSIERMLATGQTAAKIVPLKYMRVAGVSELIGVLGVMLPWLTGVARVLTPLAATGFGVIMILAAGVHTRLREPRNVAINLVILLVAGFVAWGRFGDL